MATFDRLFDPTLVERVADVTVALAERPGAARHAGHRLTLLQLRLRTGVPSHQPSAPVRGCVRRVELEATTPLPGGALELLEISLLPFNADTAPQTEATLRGLTRGVPTFYVSPFDTVVADLPATETLDHSLIDRGAPLTELTAGESLFVGVLFQDGVTVPPYTALRLIGDALATGGDAAAVTAWMNQLDVYGTERHLSVVRHDGGGLSAGATFAVELRPDAGGPAVESGTVTLGAGGDLETALFASPIGALTSLFGPPTDHHVAIRWAGEVSSGDAFPVQAIYDTGESSEPGAFLRIPAIAGSRGTLHVAEIGNWYPPVADQLNIDRFRTNSLIVPLIDGIATFQALIEDLKAAIKIPSDPAVAEFRAHFSGWTFNRFQMDPKRLRSDIVEIAEDILASGGSVLVLANQFLKLNDPELPAIRAVAVLILIALGHATILTELLVDLAKHIFTFNVGLETDDWVIFAWFSLPSIVGLLALVAAELGWFHSFLQDKVESGKDTVEDLNELAAGTAVWSPNPVRISDNPLAPLYPANPLLTLEDDCDQFGVYHNKVQLVKRRADARGDEFVAYLGGIDVNKNRFDAPGHGVGGPYHDVHVRISGPVVADVFASFYERWILDAGISRADLEAALPPPVASAMPQHTDALHIARVGRTYPATAAGYPFASDGDRGTYDTLLAAIGQARDYIYIEDQYFTPDDGYIAALVNAGTANVCKRLLILVPGETDQPFGDLRRRNALAQVRAAWGERMIVGFPQRRPGLAQADRFASRGRTWLVADCSPSTSEIHVAMPARAIKAPFWLWIDGEMMLARNVVKPVTEGGETAARITVERAPGPEGARWGTHARKHKKGAPVTLAQVKGIYVHAKCMMVDDVFVSIGSTNLNRRGFFSDGEINVFAIPQQLHAAPDNPARAARTALWAEHLGITPELGASLLRDPIAAFDLFRRSPYAGNRFTLLEATDVKPFMGVSDLSLWPVALLDVIGSLIGSLPAAFHRRVWNLVIDPTTALDVTASEGPVP